MDDKKLDAFRNEFLSWSGKDFEGNSLEEAFLIIEKQRLELEAALNIKSDFLCKCAIEIFPPDESVTGNFQIWVDS